MQQMEVAIPAGMKGVQQMQVSTPAGMMNVTIPEGKMEGEIWGARGNEEAGGWMGRGRENGTRGPTTSGDRRSHLGRLTEWHIFQPQDVLPLRNLKICRRCKRNDRTRGLRGTRQDADADVFSECKWLGAG